MAQVRLVIDVVQRDAQGHAQHLAGLMFDITERNGGEPALGDTNE